MNKFNLEVVKKKELNHATQSNIRLNKKDKTPIKLKELEKISNQILKDAPKGSKIAIKALSPTGFRSFKSFDGNLNIQDEIDYYQGEVKENSKFTNNFSQVYFLIQKPN